MITTQRAQEIRKQYEQTAEALAAARTEFNRAAAAVGDDEVAAIVTGRAKNPRLRSTVADLRDKVAQLEDALGPLRAAIALVEAQESDADYQARIEREAGIRRDYKAAVGELAEAIFAAEKAQRAADAIHAKAPLADRGNYSMPKITANINFGHPECAALFSEQVCMAGFSELVPADDLGRRRFEHGKAHEAQRHAEIEASAGRVLARKLEREFAESQAAPISAGQLLAA